MSTQKAIDELKTEEIISGYMIHIRHGTADILSESRCGKF